MEVRDGNALRARVDYTTPRPARQLERPVKSQQLTAPSTTTRRSLARNVQGFAAPSATSFTMSDVATDGSALPRATSCFAATYDNSEPPPRFCAEARFSLRSAGPPRAPCRP